MIKEITYYFQGKLTEDEAMDLWERLIIDTEAFELLETYYLLFILNQFEKGSCRK